MLPWGDRGLGATEIVTGGSGIGPGALRADMEESTGVDPCDAAATRADRMHVHHRETNGMTLELAFLGDQRLSALDQADVGAGAANIECDDVRHVDLRCEKRRTGHPGRRPRSESSHRFGRRFPSRGDATVGLKNFGFDQPHRFRPLLQTLQVAVHDGTE